MNRDTLDRLLIGMLEGNDISDLLLLPRKPPLMEISGRLQDFPIDTPDCLLTPELVEEAALQIMAGNERLQLDFAETGSCDCSYSIEDVARFRVNIFRQNGHHAIVMRKLPALIPTLEKLKLPQIFQEIVKEKTGIIFVTGATGSGKTTTLAAMIDHINRTQEIHILTLEDPIEFFHHSIKAAVSQRELGRDFRTFAGGLRAALRQAPKVILVGEIRDRETLEIALTASETGHLVFSTLHTINAGQTLNRVIGLFTRDEEAQVRQRLADTLRYVVSQRLVPRVGGGRLLVSEIMGNSLRTRETILYGESENKSFHEIIEAGSTNGWHSFDQSLLKVYESGQITEDTALTYCSNKSSMRRNLDTKQKAQGTFAKEKTSGLKLNIPEPIDQNWQPPPPPRVVQPRA